ILCSILRMRLRRGFNHVFGTSSVLNREFEPRVWYSKCSQYRVWLILPTCSNLQQFLKDHVFDSKAEEVICSLSYSLAKLIVHFAFLYQKCFCSKTTQCISKRKIS